MLSRDKAGESGSLPHACGGVLTLICQHRISRSLPHACGGVSCTVLKLYRAQASSPRMWGCFQGKMVTKDEYGVFPTHVGVFLMGNRVGKRNDKSSPRMWGQFSSRTTYQRRAFHALGHIQQELRDGQAPRTPDLEKPFQTIPPPGILLGGHAGSPARGRHGFKPCPFRRSGRGQRPPFRHGRRGGRSFPCALPPMSDGSAPPGISTGSVLASRRRQGRSPARLKILPPPPL